MTTASNEVRLVEVGPRDGFQMEPSFIPTELKVEVIDLLASAGVSKIEATSFVHPKIVPQMRDAAEVMAAIRRPPGTRFTALIPNLQGLERAVAAKVDAVRIVICATEAYNQANVGMSVDRSFEVCREVLEAASPEGLVVEAVLGVAFGCPLAGAVSEERVLELLERFAGLGLEEIAIADSVGLAHPHQVARTVRRLRRELPEIELSLHLHDTRGLGLANLAAALDEGLDTFDASLGGLGGCPTVPGATGNVATEDVVNLCEEMGFATGVDLRTVRRASSRIEEFLGRDLPSRILRTPTRRELWAKLTAA